MMFHWTCWQRNAFTIHNCDTWYGEVMGTYVMLCVWNSLSSCMRSAQLWTFTTWMSVHSHLWQRVFVWTFRHYPYSVRGPLRTNNNFLFSMGHNAVGGNSNDAHFRKASSSWTFRAIFAYEWCTNSILKTKWWHSRKCDCYLSCDKHNK